MEHKYKCNLIDTLHTETMWVDIQYSAQLLQTSEVLYSYHSKLNFLEVFDFDFTTYAEFWSWIHWLQLF